MAEAREPTDGLEVGERLAALGPGLAVGSLVEGVGRALTAPRVRGLVLLSAFLSTLLFALVIAGLIALAVIATEPLFREGWSDRVPDVAGLRGLAAGLGSAFGWTVRVAAIALAVLLSPVFFQLASALVLFGVKERLFMAARLAAGGEPLPNASVGGWLRIVGTEARRLVVVLALAVLLLPLHLIPGIGSVVYAVLSYGFAAHALAWDLLSFHFEGHDLPYAEQRRALARARLPAMALGGAALLLYLVPLGQLIFPTTNVIGAGILSARLDARRARGA